MNARTSVCGVALMVSGLSGIAALGTACSGPVKGGSTDYTEAKPLSTSTPPSNGLAGAAAPATAISAVTPHAGPSDLVATTPPPAAAPAAAPTGSAAPVAAKAPASPSTTAAPAGTGTTVASAPTTMATSTGWNAGSGMALPDGKTVVYHIPDGTGGKDWNPKENPIRVRRGMTVHLVDDDKSTRAGGHWLHTNGQPCLHGLMAIGQGFDCAISMTAPTGLISGVFEHNVANGIGQLYIEVVADAN